MNVLMIDDDVELTETLNTVLALYSITLSASHTPERGLKKLMESSFDLLLLDIMLPEINGFELCSKIRHLDSPIAQIPIIILSARTELVDRVVGLETGADDYINKPFEPRELVARIQAIKRRMSFTPISIETPNNPLGASGEFIIALKQDVLTLNLNQSKAIVNQSELELTSMEFTLLEALVKKTGDVISNDELLDQCQLPSYSQSLAALIYRLRNKIKQAGAKEDFIRTVRNQGYAFMGQVELK